MTDKKGYELLKNSNGRFIKEPLISKFVHIIFDARIKDAGFNVDISPETNVVMVRWILKFLEGMTKC